MLVLLPPWSCCWLFYTKFFLETEDGFTGYNEDWYMEDLNLSFGDQDGEDFIRDEMAFANSMAKPLREEENTLLVR
jgi:hypothetical protein